MNEKIINALNLMWQGMAGIFVVMIILYIAVIIIYNLSSKNEQKEKA